MKLYSNKHVWVDIVKSDTGFDTATIGTTSKFPAKGDKVTYLSFDVGSRAQFGFESKLATVSFYSMLDGVPGSSDDRFVDAPVVGKVLEVNTALERHPSLLEKGGENAWLVKATVIATAEGLMDEDAYKKFCEE